jgi:hypothetical protein
MKCDRFKGKVVSEEEWDKQHADHGKKRWERLDKAPQGYRLWWRVCPCGAKHLRERYVD